jgi:predicted pyridoxine 5'-phosphate oxidase superfamily flavin-nucleotide-binding protein
MKMPNKVKELFDSQVLVAVGTASKDGMPNVACILSPARLFEGRLARMNGANGDGKRPLRASR